MFNWKQKRVLILLTVGLGLVGSGCKDEQQPGSDHRIAATANAANAGEIQVGQLALTMAVNDEVKAFATRMVNEHLATQQRQTALFARLGIIPEDDATSLQLQAELGPRLGSAPLLGLCTFGEQGFVPGIGNLHQDLSVSLLLLGQPSSAQS